MPITKGHGNPRWTFDETILALDLLLIRLPGLPRKAGQQVLELSRILNQADFHGPSEGTETFRNPDGVYMKLIQLQTALLRATTEPERKGLEPSLLDVQVIEKYGRQPEMVRSLADAIRAAIQVLPDLEKEGADEDQDEEFTEGRSLTRLHRVRERSRGIRSKVISAALKNGGLVCAACGEKPPQHLGSAGEAMFEVHHVKPLASLASNAQQRTKLADVALLCASCHRLIHRLSGAECVWYTPEMLALRLKCASRDQGRSDVGR